MSTYTQILYQIVFSTKRRTRTLSLDKYSELSKYTWGILENKKCHPYIINGVEDHIHIITHLHPSVALSSLVKDIKLGTSDWIHRERVFSRFEGWQEGYGAFTYSISAKENLINYVENQRAHHMKHNFIDEYISLLKEHGITYDDKYLL
ncbi:MAG: IS200/IS605 family transposase [Bacteroidales bacterium]|nr:IS200/IS605 family transposase [Bacteroidales bacterium]